MSTMAGMPIVTVVAAVGAGIVLYATDRRFLTAAAIQAGPPLLALMTAFVL
jgi:hypothetical protein